MTELTKGHRRLTITNLVITDENGRDITGGESARVRITVKGRSEPMDLKGFTSPVLLAIVEKTIKESLSEDDWAAIEVSNASVLVFVNSPGI